MRYDQGPIDCYGCKPGHERQPPFTLVRKDDPTFMPGRREFLTYRDLGITAASGGRIRAQITSAKTGLTRPTGWHTHICEGQIVYMLSGWIDL